MKAVEWFANELLKSSPYTVEEFHDIYVKALAMEKEQIVTTWNTAHQAGRFEGKGIAEENWQTFETYWELTFKSE